MQHELIFFDIQAYLEDRGIDVQLEGKDVTEGWIGIPCLWCSDLGHHLGINLESKYTTCWRCGSKGSIINIVRAIDNCSWSEATEIIKRYQDYSLPSYIGVTPSYSAKQVNWPNNLSIIDYLSIPKRVHHFLSSRGFNPLDLCKHHTLYYPVPEQMGDYKFRIVIPIIHHMQEVAFTSRDVTGVGKPAYLNPENKDCIIPIKHTLYGLDEALPGNPVVVVEGPLDQWKLGNGSVATYGTAWTMEQVRLLRELKPSKIYIWYDSDEDAQMSADRLGEQIWFADCYKLHLLDKNDPGDLTAQEAKEIMDQIQTDVYGMDNPHGHTPPKIK